MNNNIFKDIIDKAKDKYLVVKAENDYYNEMLSKTDVVTDLEALPYSSLEDTTISYKDILDECLDLNDEKAMTIRRILLLDEEFLTVRYARECKSNLEYFLVPTNKRFLVISLNGYKEYEYNNVEADVVKNNIFGKVLNINNVLFSVNGSDEKINEFLMIFKDANKREALSYLKCGKYCGIKPIFRMVNDIGTGISIDSNGMIVFHSKKFNYKYNFLDIINYELLLDGCVVRERKLSGNRRVRLSSFKNSCSEMSIRVSTKDKTFLLPIIEVSSFSEHYLSTSSTYINGKSFADKLIEKLDEFDNIKY